MKVSIYSRVSTAGQSVDMQVNDLRQYASQRGFEIFKEYSDIGFSGSKDSRPALNELMSDARKKRFSIVLVWRFDRFARSTKHLVNSLSEFNHLGIDFISFQENIDTSSPIGKVLFSIIAAMAQFERDIIRERVKAGMASARNKGIRFGRPSKLHEDVIYEISEMRAAGQSIRQIAKVVKLSPALVHKTLQISKAQI